MNPKELFGTVVIELKRKETCKDNPYMLNRTGVVQQKGIGNSE